MLHPGEHLRSAWPGSYHPTQPPCFRKTLCLICEMQVLRYKTYISTGEVCCAAVETVQLKMSTMNCILDPKSVQRKDTGIQPNSSGSFEPFCQRQGNQIICLPEISFPPIWLQCRSVTVCSTANPLSPITLPKWQPPVVVTTSASSRDGSIWLNVFSGRQITPQ